MNSKLTLNISLHIDDTFDEKNFYEEVVRDILTKKYPEAKIDISLRRGSIYLDVIIFIREAAGTVIAIAEVIKRFHRKGEDMKDNEEVISSSQRSIALEQDKGVLVPSKEQIQEVLCRESVEVLTKIISSEIASRISKIGVSMSYGEDANKTVYNITCDLRSIRNDDDETPLI